MHRGGLLQVLFHLAFCVGMMALFFHNPHIIMGLFQIIFCLGLLLFGAVLYAVHRQREGKPLKGVTINESSTPFVGMQGRGIRLTVQHEGGKLRISLSRADYLLIIAILLFFGPGLIVLFLTHPEKIHHGAPWFAYAGVGLMITISTLLLLHYLREFLFNKPMVEASAEAIRFLRGSKQCDIAWKRDIENFAIAVSSVYIGGSGVNNRRVENYTLNAVAAGGKTYGLCITDGKDSILSLKRDLERMMNVAGREV